MTKTTEMSKDNSDKISHMYNTGLTKTTWATVRKYNKYKITGNLLKLELDARSSGVDMILRMVGKQPRTTRGEVVSDAKVTV